MQSEVKDSLWRAPSLIASFGRRPASGACTPAQAEARGADGWRRTETSRAGGGALPQSDWTTRPQSAREAAGDRTRRPGLFANKFSRLKLGHDAPVRSGQFESEVGSPPRPGAVAETRL